MEKPFVEKQLLKHPPYQMVHLSQDWPLIILLGEVMVFSSVPLLFSELGCPGGILMAGKMTEIC